MVDYFRYMTKKKKNSDNKTTATTSFISSSSSSPIIGKKQQQRKKPIIRKRIRRQQQNVPQVVLFFLLRLIRQQQRRWILPILVIAVVVISSSSSSSLSFLGYELFTISSYWEKYDTSSISSSQSSRQEEVKSSPVVTACKYHGNCPIGTSCVKNYDDKKKKKKGTIVVGECLPYQGRRIKIVTTNTNTTTVNRNATQQRQQRLNPHKQQQQQFDYCISECRKELEYDEYYYYGTQLPIKIYDTYQGLLHGQQHGCVLTYGRIKQNKKKPGSAHPPSHMIMSTTKIKFDDWIQQRYRRIVRIDPYYINSNNYEGHDVHHQPQQQNAGGETLWNVLCEMPCHTDEDCHQFQQQQLAATHDPDDDEMTSSVATCEMTSNAANQIINDGGETTTGDSSINRILQSTKTCQYSQTQNDKSNTNNDDIDNDMVIVTGSNSDYFKALVNFISSVIYWAPNHKIVIYNLGMTTAQLQYLQETYMNHTVVDIHWWDRNQQSSDSDNLINPIPTYYPDHVRYNIHNYAWKSIIINETVHKYKSIFWVDSGATIVGPITPIQEIIHRTGIFLVKGQDEDMKYLSHESTYQTIQKYISPISTSSSVATTTENINKETWPAGRPHYAGGIQGHVYPSKYIDTIVIPNAQCALDVTCISPEGSSLYNHRYDQTSLSILAYNDRVTMVPHHTEYLAANFEQLNDDLRYTNGSRYVIWTSRKMCNFYKKLYKTSNNKKKKKKKKEETNYDDDGI